jgi:glycosyltransferase involved in cell wall biosynthesis
MASETDIEIGSNVVEAQEPSLFQVPARAAAELKLAGKRAGMVVFSSYPADPRPRRAAEALLDEGMSIDLICEAEEELPRKEHDGALDITRIPIRHFRGGVVSYAYQYIAFIAWSAGILALRMPRRRYDLVYVHNMPDVLIVTALLPKLFGAKVILDQHDPMPELMTTIFGMTEKSIAVRIIRLLEKLSIGCADLVITVNEACKKIFAERSCRAEKIAVIMNCPDPDIFPLRVAESYMPSAPEAPFVVMYHGSLVERNGLDLAVDAVARVVQTVPNVELRVYGRSSSYLEQVMSKVDRLGLNKRVRYLGPRKLEDLAKEIECCDVGIIPNHRNSFTEINTPTRIFEYLALGKPVIAPSTRGILDYFRHDSLFFFEPGDADGLGRAIRSVAAQPNTARQVANKGQEVYLQHNWTNERKALASLVAELLGA